MLLAAHDKGINLKVNDVIELQGYQKNKINDKHLIILSRAPIRKAECKVQIGLQKTLEWADDQDFEELVQGVSLDIPMPKQPVVSVLSMDTPAILNKKDTEIIENPEDEELKMNPFGDCTEIQYTPIAALSCNTHDWIIKARVTKKYDRKSWSNSRGNGYLLNVDLIDQFGTQIQATMFKDAVDKFDSVLKENSVYTFTNGQIKMANQRFSSIRNDFSLVFDKNTMIKPTDDDEKIQSQAYSFTVLHQILDITGQRTLDFIGIVHFCGQVKDKSLRNGTSKAQRNLLLADESGKAIQLSIWGDFANKFELKPDEHPVVAIKRATVSDYNGKSLNTNESSSILINPKIKRTKQLLEWYKRLNDPS